MTTKTYGEPGGIYLELHKDLKRGDFYLLNEGGDELVRDPSEEEVRLYAKAIILSESQ